MYRADEFRKVGCEVVACSTDSHFSHLAWCERSRKQGGLGDMNIPLLADKSMAISRAYGVLKVSGVFLSIRGIFLADPVGTGPFWSDLNPENFHRIRILSLLWQCKVVGTRKKYFKNTK